MGRRPKNTTADQGDVLVRYTRGCNCKRSGCLKNYCECYEAKMLCSVNCKCAGCRNKEAADMEFDTTDTTMAPTLPATTQPQLNIADGNTARASVKRVYCKREDIPKPSEVATKQTDKDEQKESAPPAKEAFISEESIAATVTCLIRAGASAERVNLPDTAMEICLFEEMGRCLKEFLTTTINKSFYDN